jgi:hypothetical protein
MLGDLETPNLIDTKIMLSSLKHLRKGKTHELVAIKKYGCSVKSRLARLEKSGYLKREISSFDTDNVFSYPVRRYSGNFVLTEKGLEFACDFSEERKESKRASIQKWTYNIIFAIFSALAGAILARLSELWIP